MESVDHLGGGRAERLDCYPPAGGTSRRAAVLVVHGGGWRQGGRGDARERQACILLAGAGYLAASVGYRLPDVDGAPTWPRNLHDVVAGVKWLRRHAGRLGIDPARIAALGFSAGAHLALLAAYGAGDARLDAPEHAGTDPGLAAVIACYGVPDARLPFLGRAGPCAAAMLGASADAARYALASPIEHVRPGCPPTLLLHGEADELVPCEWSRDLVARLARAGVAHRWLPVPGAPHSFPLVSPHGDLSRPVLSFLAEHLP